MGPNSIVGRWYESLAGRSLPFSFLGILIGSVIYNFPFAVRPFTAAFASVDRRLIEASWCLGRFASRDFSPRDRPSLLARAFSPA